MKVMLTVTCKKLHKFWLVYESCFKVQLTRIFYTVTFKTCHLWYFNKIHGRHLKTIFSSPELLLTSEDFGQAVLETIPHPGEWWLVLNVFFLHFLFCTTIEPNSSFITQIIANMDILHSNNNYTNLKAKMDKSYASFQFRKQEWCDNFEWRLSITLWWCFLFS